MAKTDSTFIYVATYPDEMAAQDDYQAVKDLHSGGLVGAYDAAVVTKDAHGQGAREQGRDGHPPRGLVGRRGGRSGGRAVPAFGAGRGRSRRRDRRGQRPPGQGHVPVRAKELGDFIDPGQAGLVVVGETKVGPPSRRP